MIAASYIINRLQQWLYYVSLYKQHYRSHRCNCCHLVSSDSTKSYGGLYSSQRVSVSL